jgi:polysaccharide biosynthesis transport protein
MATEYEFTLTDYLSVLKRRWLLMLAVFMLIVLAALAVAISMSPVYQSTGTILVESQQIPDDVVKATVTTYADERIEVIKQRVMTRDNLSRIIGKYKLYPKKINSETTSTLIELMRQSVSVELLNADVQNASGGKATIAFKVGFEYEQADVAHKVANEIVTLFLDENVKTRTLRATETTEFLTQEVGNLKKELENVENKVATYKQQNSDSLPEHMEMHMNMLHQAELDIKEIDRDYKSTQEELRYLDVDLATTSANAKRNSSTNTNTNTELDKAKADLELAQAIYKDTHPTVRALKRQIENLEAAAAKPTVSKSIKSDLETDMVLGKIRSQIEAAKIRLASLAQQKKSTQEKVSELQGQVIKSPQVEKGLSGLLRDYDNAKSKYEEVKSKQLNAKIAENLEQENKAERFSLIEPPVFPDKPIRPNRMKIIALGVIAALGASIALAVLLEVLEGKLRGVDAVTSVINMRPLVIVPYVYTQVELRRKRIKKRYVLLALGLLLIFLLMAIHFLWMPLDLLLVKLMARLT